MSKSVKSIIQETLSDFIKEETIENSIEINENTRLFGSDALFTSIQLVSFITDLEENLEDELDVYLTLADEKAMSRRTSPFSSVKYLISYVEEKIKEDE
jgi:acyl carrier protein